MKIKILTLNIWRYDGDWKKRKPKMVKFIQKENPDIVFLQEVFDDSRHNAPKNNQALQLNNYLKFKSNIYHIVERVKTEHKQPIKIPIFDGLCCLTNHKVISIKLIKLKKQSGDRHYRAIQRIKLNIKGKNVTFYHTHLSNREDWAIFHLKECLEKAKKESSLPIIVGDLNIINTKDLIKFVKGKYKVSYEFKKYVSFPEKKETLDYVLIPKKEFRFTELVCKIRGISDHKPLITVIEFN